MPNWCSNKLTVSHTDKTTMDRFVSAYNAGKACSEFLPMPEDSDWYSWRIENWGTKWDIGADIGTDREEQHGLKATVVGNEASMSFDSAWSPPIGLYEKLVELGFSVEATYFEPEMAFCGIWTDGDDLYTQYSDKGMIPVRIWEDYNLDEFFNDEVEA